MTCFISLLRGINVSGKNIIPMKALKKSYLALGFQNPITYLQSGNVIFSGEAITDISKNISLQIEKDFGLTVSVLVLNATELKAVIDNNPFADDSSKNPAYFHVTFLSSVVKDVNLSLLNNSLQAGEDFRMREQVVYLYCPNGYGRTKLTTNFLESTLKVKATTRNWKTTNALFAQASAIQ